MRSSSSSSPSSSSHHHIAPPRLLYQHDLHHVHLPTPPPRLLIPSSFRLLPPFPLILFLPLSPPKNSVSVAVSFPWNAVVLLGEQLSETSVNLLFVPNLVGLF